ncbi:UNVERIFIED_CONTAM: hypothetical protein GTU68_060949 [Idotea baltica]|nr:hypothetical protein [Idotea baltica]
MKTLIWFRRDLRVTDNKALYYAAKSATDGVVALFVATPQQWKEHDDADCKISFWMANLRLLSESLAKLNIPLLIEKCNSFEDAPNSIVKIAKKHKCSSVFWNREYEVNETNRDRAVAKACQQESLEVNQFHDRVIVPPREISTKEGRFYSVFTPYRKVWNGKALDFIEPLAKPRKQPPTELKPAPIPSKLSGFQISNKHHERFPAGEPEARKRLKRFTKKISGYNEARDFPSLDGTSQLSPYLVAGVISPRQCMTTALALNQGKPNGPNDGATTWISELAWRDFYTHVMVGFPRVSKHQPFKLKTNAVGWRKNEKDFEAWKSGQTGYPIVDAGMRQLNQTGWMHNRLRMVTAMFLTKHLLIDWRWGERYFMQRLIDGDLAANNGGWQWSASTGTDSVPYFRIFNPFSQSKRFDPESKFIKQYCPELNSVPAASLHDPVKLAKAIKEAKSNYPAAVVEHKSARQRALEEFKALS